MKIFYTKILFLTILLFFLAACQPQAATPTPDIAKTAQQLANQMQTATAASLPTNLPAPQVTDTPAAPPTVTPTATPQATATSAADYSQIHYATAQTHYTTDGTPQTVFILDTGNITSNFTLIVRGHEYSCQRFEDYPGQIWCYGPYLPPGYEDTMYLYLSGADYSQDTPVFEQVFGFPIAPTPTLYGVTCIYEPLSAIGQSTDSSCYAITCTYQGQYYGGTKNSCTDPWP